MSWENWNIFSLITLLHQDLRNNYLYYSPYVAYDSSSENLMLNQSISPPSYIFVIHLTGGPYWEKLCPRSWIPKTRQTRQRAQFFPIRTDLGWWITFLFFLKPSKWLRKEPDPLWAVRMGRILPALGTNQIAGFVEYRPLTNWEKNYVRSCRYILLDNVWRL